jgi:hypothetical protein
MRSYISLDHLQVASPCDKNWNAMQGDERKRFCGSCNKHVHDLSQLTEHEAVSLFEQHRQRGSTPCVTYVRDTHGKPKFAPSKGWFARTVSFALALMTLIGCTAEKRERRRTLGIVYSRPDTSEPNTNIDIYPGKSDTGDVYDIRNTRTLGMPPLMTRVLSDTNEERLMGDVIWPIDSLPVAPKQDTSVVNAEGQE